MSYEPETYAECPDIQVMLNDNFIACRSDLQSDPVPLLEWLMSPLNRTGYSAVVAPGEAKVKNVIQVYNQPIAESDVTQPGTDRDCVATQRRGNLTYSCTLDTTTYQQVDELIKNTDFKTVCQRASDLLPDKLTRMVNALRSKLATQLTNDAAPLLGDWGQDVPSSRKVAEGGVDFLKIATTRATSGDIDPRGMMQVDSALELTQWCNRGGAAVFAGLNQWEYYKLMKAGCCSNQGLDVEAIRQMYGYSVQWDRRVALAAGNDYAWVLQPGALQVVTYTENDNGVSEAIGVQAAGSNYMKSIIHDPLTGFPIDLTIKDDCGNVSIIMRALGKLCGLPYGLFPEGHHLLGVNFFAGIKIVNPA